MIKLISSGSLYDSPSTGDSFLALIVSGVVALLGLKAMAPLEMPLALDDPLELPLLDIVESQRQLGVV